MRELFEFMIEITWNTLSGKTIASIFYGIGWLFLRLMTLGHYPPSDEQEHSQTFVTLVGVTLVAIVIVYFIRFR